MPDPLRVLLQLALGLLVFLVVIEGNAGGAAAAGQRPLPGKPPVTIVEAHFERGRFHLIGILVVLPRRNLIDEDA